MNKSSLDEQLLLLKLAGDMLMYQHQDQRLAIHNNWYLSSQQSVARQAAASPYPEMPPAPTEAELFEKAHELASVLFPPAVAKPTSLTEEAVTSDAPQQDSAPLVVSEPEQETVEQVPDTPLVEESEEKDAVPILDEETQTQEKKDANPVDNADQLPEPQVQETSVPLVQSRFGGINNWFWLSKKS